MSHKLLSDDIIETKPRRTVKEILFPKGFSPSGRFGLSAFLGNKEIFIGLMVGNVETETIVRKKIVPLRKGKVNVYKFDATP